MLKANYHTHTYRCGHASGEDEDYLKEALGAGMVELGYSDHIMLPGYSEVGIRGDFSLFEDYISSITNIKNKYKDRIKVYIGFEAEAFPQYYPFYRELISSKKIDYLILGNHLAMDDNKKIFCHFSKIKSASELYLYRDLTFSSLQTGCFKCFAHPDYFMSNIENIDKDVKKVMSDIVSLCVELDIPLEINLAGIRNGMKKIGKINRYVYPTDLFLQTCQKYNAKVIIGQDAHSPKQIDNLEANEKAIMLVRKYNLNLIEKLKIN